MTTPPRQPAAQTLSASQVAAWQPVLASCYGLLGAATLVFLAAGFAAVGHLLRALGSVSPDASALGPYVGMFVAVALLTICALPFARRDLARCTSGRAVAHRAGAMIAIALVLAFPVSQWLTFGRPTAISRYGAGPSAANSARKRDAMNAQPADTLPAGVPRG